MLNKEAVPSDLLQESLHSEFCTKHLMLDRQFKGMPNFRDMGGLQTVDGRWMKSGILYRSDNPSKLSEEEIDRLRVLQLKLIIDLRTPNERKNKVLKLSESDGTRIVHVPILQNDRDYTNMQFLIMMLRSARTMDCEQMMLSFYRKMVSVDLGEIRYIINLLADQEHLPALIHCRGGKDRTGILSALLQLLAGVPKDTVMQNYLLSNEFIERDMRRASLFIRAMSLFQLSGERIRPLLEAREHYLEAALDEIFSSYTSIEDYFIKGCGLRETVITKLKHNLID